MPRRPNIPCKHPSCSRLVLPGTKFCEEHDVFYRADARTTKEKGYDARWRKARAWYLKCNPICIRCLREGKFVKATVVDHIKPHRGDEQPFWDESNWQALCKYCHDKKTMTEDRYQEYKY